MWTCPTTNHTLLLPRFGQVLDPRHLVVRQFVVTMVARNRLEHAQPISGNTLVGCVGTLLSASSVVTAGVMMHNTLIRLHPHSIPANSKLMCNSIRSFVSKGDGVPLSKVCFNSLILLWGAAGLTTFLFHTDCTEVQCRAWYRFRR